MSGMEIESTTPPNNPEPRKNKRIGNTVHFLTLKNSVIKRSRDSTRTKLEIMNRSTEVDKFYDDDVVTTLSEEFFDRLRVKPLIGDIIRALRIAIKRRALYNDEFIEIAVRRITSRERISRADVSELTDIETVYGNSLIPFMNGGPAGENWNNASNGFYDWIDKKSQESILGIELGFKADSYGIEVGRKLIEKKRANPHVYISILIDGFVSIIMQKPPTSLKEFEMNTLKLLVDMKEAGINVYVNDSWNPLSSDFLAANHIKLWIFDGKVAFFGGIGIESQFRKLLYDQMDLVQGPFVNPLTSMALLVMTNQKNRADLRDSIRQFHEMHKDEIEDLFLKKITRVGNVTIKLSMNIPGYIQDAQKDYVELLSRKDVEEIYIMAPYFSDDKVARALIKTADRLQKIAANKKKKEIKTRFNDLSRKQIRGIINKEIENEKRIHVIFPKKQENRIIEEISRYYAYYLRNNPIVETRQFYAEVDTEKYEMLHAKQMVLILRNDKQKWTKYVKFGGSYNPAGRAHNMWELNAIMFNGNWTDSDETMHAHPRENPIKDYLDNVMKVVVTKYSEPFPWGDIHIKISWGRRIFMKFVQLLWF
jgi:hypothetical protein